VQREPQVIASRYTAERVISKHTATPSDRAAPSPECAARGRAELPTFRIQRTRDRVLCASVRFERELIELGWLRPGRLEAVLAGGCPGAGRGPTSRIELDASGVELHLRPLRHGGWLAPLWRDFELGLSRPRREIEVTRLLHARGAPVPEPALFAAVRYLGPVWRAAVGTLHIAGSRTLLEFLRDPTTSGDRIRAARAAGAALARFHGCGGQHADLHLGNLLIRKQGDRFDVTVIDLDRARAGAPPGPRRRARELSRLWRHARKHGVACSLDQRIRAAFAAAYCGRDRALRSALAQRLELSRSDSPRRA
jgi:hypothetical protein